MSSEERKKILQMVADGKINAQEAATLMRALDDSAEEQIQVIEAGPSFGSEKTDAPEFDQVRRRANRFSSAFLSIGIIFTVLSAWAMFGIQKNNGLNFWFFCMTMPLFLGILLTMLGAGSRTSRWMYVNVDRSHQTEFPRNITIAFPLPLGLVAWFLKNFGGSISGLKKTNVDEIIQAIAMAKNITEPLIVNVDDGDDGEKVQVFIG
ncbi:hypothetical protein [Candidatus Villigracilis saccharophilus]|uniref:SHOCT-like domain-containing protein n=1 Tax=Candidatus Villigracilis saccharophilus TaxID=3140684 RepID=UPI00313761E0|nr:hypothetical protein [Anaerolineales bacterium]